MMMQPDPEPLEQERSSDRHAAEPPVTDCCGGSNVVDPRIQRHFDKQMLARAAAGELPPLVAVSQRMLELLDDVGDARPTVLELGCGSGGLTVALLERGAVAADGVDLSPESLNLARRRATDAGVADRARFELGDGAQVELRPRDWVVLDRVMCCYPRLDELLGNAVPAATRRFVFSVPCSRGWRGFVTRLVVGLENATDVLRGHPCPGYVHDIGRIESSLVRAGFGRRADVLVGTWYAAVWERPAPEV